MTDLFKFGRACAIGSAVLVALSLAIMPKFWFLGLIAGIAGGYIAGYLGYEFQKVAEAAPTAFSQLFGIGGRIKVKSSSMLGAISKWFKTYHAYLVPGCIIGLALSPFAIEAVRNLPYAEFSWYDWALWVALPFMICGLIVFCLGLLNVIGTEMHGKSEFAETEYTMVLYYIAIGLCGVVAFFTFYLWKYLTIGVLKLLKMIHTRERVACGVDSVIGGLFTLWGFLRWNHAPLSVSEYLLAVFFGALVGGALGIVLCQLLRKPQEAAT